MTDDSNNGDYWKYEVDTVQRHGTTAATKARRHGKVSYPEPSDDHEPKERNEGTGFDRDGIPEGI